MAAANATANAAAERAIGNPQTAMLSYRSTTAAKKGGGGTKGYQKGSTHLHMLLIVFSFNTFKFNTCCLHLTPEAGRRRQKAPAKNRQRWQPPA